MLQKLEWLYLTYGVLFGAGASLAYFSSLVILGHYFKRRMSMVNGLVTAGSAVFTIGKCYTKVFPSAAFPRGFPNKIR